MRVAITGGIGSGKSYVCRLLARHGIAVYDSDAHAKRLIRTSLELQQQLRKSNLCRWSFAKRSFSSIPTC